MFKFVIALIAISLLNFASVQPAYAQDNDPPRTTGEGDQIIQDIAAGLPPAIQVNSGPMAGINDASPSDTILSPVTGGVIVPDKRRGQGMGASAVADADASSNATTVIALSSVVVGLLLVGTGTLIQRQHRQSMRRRRRGL